MGRGCEVFVKYEGMNPTGSFKDRGNDCSRLESAGAWRENAHLRIDRQHFRLRGRLRRPRRDALRGDPARGQDREREDGAGVRLWRRVVAIEGNFDQALEIVRALGQREDFAVVNSINPDRIAGQKTAAFEIVDELGDAPDLHLLPVGNAGNITAYWSGYEEFRAAGKATRSPRMIGFQAEGAAPIFRDEIVVRPETVATAIRIGNPASWAEANCAIKESGGTIDIVSDEEILDAQRWLASAEGIFVEPASAAPIAGLLRACDLKNAARFNASAIAEGCRIVCTVTGHGLKDPGVIATTSDAAVEPNESAVRRALEKRWS